MKTLLVSSAAALLAAVPPNEATGSRASFLTNMLPNFETSAAILHDIQKKLSGGEKDVQQTDDMESDVQSLLQISTASSAASSTAANAAPQSFFEDALPATSRNRRQLSKHDVPVAPNDVGSQSVPLPVQALKQVTGSSIDNEDAAPGQRRLSLLEAPEGVGQALQEAKRSPPEALSKVEEAAYPPGPGGKFFDDEDGDDLAGTHVGADQASEATKHLMALEERADLKAQDLDRAQPAKLPLFEPTAQPPFRSETEEARDFFENMGDSGSSYTGTEAQPRIALNEADEQRFLSQAQSRPESRTQWDSSTEKGHSLDAELPKDSKPTHGETGEEGELFRTYADPRMLKMEFPIKSEATLLAERTILQKQDEVVAQQLNTTKAYGELQAATFHSAQEADTRAKQKEGLETMLRRAQLLNDANSQRALLARNSRIEAENIAALERSLHLNKEVIQKEKELETTAEEKAHEYEIARLDNLHALEAKQQQIDEQQRESEALASQHRQDFASSISSHVLSDDLSGDLVARQYQEVSKAIMDAQRAKAQREADLKTYYQMANAIADGDRESTSPNTVRTDYHKPISLLDIGEVAKFPVRSDTSLADLQQLLSGIPNVEANGTADVLNHSSVSGTAVPDASQGAQSPTQSEPKHCHPQCTWQCEASPCNEVCEPICEPPVCETRCSGMDTSACSMECETPHCAVTCPSPNSTCGGEDCPTCMATCSEAKCKLQCPADQPCRNVCEHPKCEWKCRAPDQCPAPRCHMTCQSPLECQGSTHEELPPLAPGETSVASFTAPSSLLETQATLSRANTVDVKVKHRLGGNASSFLKLIHKVVKLPVVPPA